MISFQILRDLEQSSRQSVRSRSQTKNLTPKIQFQSTDKQEREDISEVSAECLTTCLQTIGIAYDILCDSRISLFTHTLLHAPPPKEFPTTGKTREPIDDKSMSGLWHILVDPKTSKRITTLTARGKEWFEDLNSISPDKFHVTNPLPPNYFETQFLELILDPNHTLCDNSLTILRRCHGNTGWVSLLTRWQGDKQN